MKSLMDQMCRRVLRHTDGIRSETAVPRLALGVLHGPSVPGPLLSGPGVCIILQGSKQMLIGGNVFRYGPASCFVSLIEMAAARFIFEPELGRPYVSAGLHFDPESFGSFIAEFPDKRMNEAAPALSVEACSRELLEAWDRHLALLDSPGDIPGLAAARERELLYRLLQSPHGSLLRQIARRDGKLAQIRRAIERMREHLDESTPITTLALIAGMSVPSFNRHFKAATSTSPLQYLKILRLQAARRLLATNVNAADAAYAVGYESPSQFNREYTRLFGLPPKKDAARSCGTFTVP